ncbi:hypothetical protein FACS1894126_6190 [Alphaproteobacteria bacterium]|nr:hypothetical protein FACS1894126_6190 [Alphaproteobacteria bacterium]
MNEYKKQFKFHYNVDSKDVTTAISACLNFFNCGQYGIEEFSEIKMSEIDVKPKYFRFGYGDTTAAQK